MCGSGNVQSYEEKPMEDSQPLATILIVDDEPSTLELLVESVKELGYQALTAKNGKEGLKILEDEKVDVVISDIIMPEMGGLEFLEKARDMGFTNPFALLSGYGEKDNVKKALFRLISFLADT